MHINSGNFYVKTPEIGMLLCIKTAVKEGIPKCVSSSAGNTVTNYLVSKEISTLAVCGNTKAEA
jgi:hypothetical protein